MPCIARLLAVVALGLLLCGPTPARAQGRPDCTAVLHAYHRMSGHNGARVPDPDRIAVKLGVDSDYVEQCARAYGRSVKHAKTSTKNGEDAEEDQDTSAKEEGKEFEEIGKEERGLPANAVQADLDKENDKDRNLLRRYDPDSSAEWEPDLGHEWEPDLGKEWKPYLLDDDE